MKIGIYADAHFSLNSSIVLGSTNSLSGRLNYLIDSFRWMYEFFKSNNVELIIDLGDLADSYNLRAEEITAISKSLSYNDTVPEYHILGNHERLDESGTINSINFVNNFSNHRVINQVEQFDIQGKSFTIIPYSKYEDGCFDQYKKTDYAFSHIDIFGADTGGWSLKSGLSPVYLTTKFGLTINGHIHNGSWVIDKKIINLGSISGQNFSSKQIHWNPSVAILDTETGEITLYENPHALIFINVNCNDLSGVINLVKGLKSDRSYAVQVKVPLKVVEDARKIVSDCKSVIVSRVLTMLDKSELGSMTYEEIDKVNSVEGGFKQLVDFINEQDSLPYDKSDILKVVTELEDNKLV